MFWLPALNLSRYQLNRLRRIFSFLAAKILDSKKLKSIPVLKTSLRAGDAL
jgi:hypothetical protein